MATGGFNVQRKSSRTVAKDQIKVVSQSVPITPDRFETLRGGHIFCYFLCGMTPGGNPSWEMKPGTVLGSDRFLLIEPLGQGGMGVVWLAHDQRLDEDVALKLVPPEIRTDAGALEDLRRETLRSRKLSHPNIIRLHDLNEFSGEPPFISMEFVDGQTVAAWKAQQPQRLLPWEQIRTLTRQLCDALEYAHGEKVVHRDLKPANMMLDRRGRLKLADFGLAAVVSELTSRVSIKANTSGTPAYMSPQQMDGRTPRVTDDIYALGATLYELLTSKPPFYHGDIPHQVRNLPPDPVEQRLSELELTNAVPPYVSALIMACLAKDPAQRPQSAAAVAEWLQLGGQSVTSALASEITHRSQPAVPAAPSSSHSTTPVPVAVPVVNAPPADQEPPEPGADEVAQSQKISGKLKVLMVFSVLILLGIVVAVVMRSSDNYRTATDANQPDAASTGRDSTPPVTPAGAQALFNGRDFSGWRKLGPDTWRVEKGVIKGLTREPRRSFLVSDRRISGNFEIAFEYKPSSRVEGSGSHGLFYRSTMPSGSGNQMATGLGIVLGGTPGGLYSTRQDGSPGNVNAPYPQPEWRMDDWNSVRVLMEGTMLRHFINGRMVFQINAEQLSTVPLGDQIAFEIWNDTGGGERSVEIRNISLMSRPTTGSRVGEDGWENLYQSTVGSLDAFRGFKESGFPNRSWTVENGLLKSIPGAPQVDLITKSTYRDFEFQMEYDISPGSNSGVIYRATEEGKNSFDTGAEMQLLGDGEIRGINADNKRHGALYGVLAVTGTPGRKPPGGNFVGIKVQNGRVEHSINGQPVLQYTWDSPELRQSISRSSFKHPGFMKATEGHIVIQHHGSDITIRQMRVRRL